MLGRLPWTTAVALAAAVILAAACTDASDAPSDLPTIGMMRVVADEDHGVFVSELRAQGWNVGPDLVILPSDPEQLLADSDAAAATLDEWLDAGVDVVVAFSTPFARLAVERAPKVPVLFLLNDPVAAGLVGDPERPDQGATGVTFRTPADRTLDLTLRLLGENASLGYLAPTDDPAVEGHRTAVLAAAEAHGIEMVEATFDGDEAVSDAVDELRRAEVGAVILASSTATVRAIDALRDALAGAELPVVANTDFIDFAVLIVTPDGAEVRRQLARQAARLLAGADPASVPVEDPRKFVVIVNRTLALELGLPEPDPELLRQADVVR